MSPNDPGLRWDGPPALQSLPFFVLSLSLSLFRFLHPLYLHSSRFSCLGQDVAVPDANDLGRLRASTRAGESDGRGLGDVQLLQRHHATELASGQLILLPEMARRSSTPFNEAQLSAVAKAGCFLVPQGGAGVMTFYNPGLHVVHDLTGKERCAANGAYFHYFTTLPGRAGHSIVYNIAGNLSRLEGALRLMCETPVCEVNLELRG